MTKPRSPNNALPVMDPHSGRARELGALIPRIVTRLLRSWSRNKATAALSGLLLHPELQSNCGRLEALVHASLAKSTGRKSPSISQLSAAFNLLGQSQLGLDEDPAEDIMIANVIFQHHNYRIPTGLWESAGFYLQRTLDVIDSMPDEQGFNDLRASIRAILVLADRVCERAGLERNQLGNEFPLSELPHSAPESLKHLTTLTLFTSRDLTALGVTASDLRPFILDSSNYRGLLQAEAGESLLERRPLTQFGPSLRVALPTAVTVAIRRLVIEAVYGTRNQPSYEEALSVSYQAFFSRTPVLGAWGMPFLPFSRIGTVHVAVAHLSADIDTTLQLIFIVDGLARYDETGWTGIATLDRTVFEFVVSRIDEAAKGASRGASLIVQCGWGRGWAINLPRLRRPGWWIDAISAADLATLSWCSEVDPLTILKLIDGEEKLASTGIELQNINGMLNLYAWAKSNDFHLVPHSSFPEGLSPEDGPMLVVIEQNAFRQLRHETLVDWDEHAIALRDGRSIVVRRQTNTAMFSEDRRKPLYLSFDDVARGRLRGVYVASSFRLWCTAVSGADQDHDLCYRIWDAAMHWMMRVAPLIDRTCGPAIPPDIEWTIHGARDSHQPCWRRPVQHGLWRHRGPAIRTDVPLSSHTFRGFSVRKALRGTA